MATRRAGGRTAVYAAPTNELLREVSARLGDTPHHVRMGVLGVIDDAGKPACRKFAAAKAVMAAGGNVHRSLCASCEYKDGCPARSGAASVVAGGGTLYLTNQALMPSVARELVAAGRTPLLVWDESPAFTEIVDLPWTDLRSLRERCLADVAPVAVGFAAMGSYPVFDAREAGLLGAMCDVLLAPGEGPGTIGDWVAQWGALRANRGRVRSIRGSFDLPLRGDGEALTPEEFTETLEVAGGAGADASGVAFDRLPADVARAHAAAWRVARTVQSAFSEGAALRVLPGAAGGILGVGLSESGRLWRAGRGGVVVADATADTALLAAVRGGGPERMRVVDIHVADAGRVARQWVFCRGLTRGGLDPAAGAGRAAWDAVGADLRVRLARSPGGASAARVVVFAFKSILDAGWKLDLNTKDTVYAYFGNTRGYNKYFEQGFTHYVTVGDPYPNIGAMELESEYLGIDAQRRVVEVAISELAQAHGRSRDPQRVGYTRTHLHYGALLPGGWAADNTEVDALT
jgi:hypothetical protein